MQHFDFKLVENQYIGMNDRLPSHELPRGLFSLLDNVLIADNKIVKRPGNSGSTAIAGSQNMLGSSAFEPAGGTKLQVVLLNGASNSQLYASSNGVGFSAIGSANLTKDALMNFSQASNRLFGFDGAEVVDYDGTTVTKNRSGVPIGKYSNWFHNYLFVAGVSGNPSRLYWSNLGAPITFSGTDFIDINANDGDAITGISQFNNELIVFKSNSVWSITGFSGSTFTTTTIAGQNTNSQLYGFGTPSHRSIIAAGKHIYYLSFVGGIPHIRALERTLYGVIIDAGVMSYEIETTMKGLNLNQLSRVAGIYDGKYCYWALPNGSSTTNTIVIVLWNDQSYQTPSGPMKPWVKWSSGLTVDNWFLSTISGRAKIYWSDASTTGKVFLVDSSVSTDNGTATVATVQTRDIVADQATKAHYKYMYIKYDTGAPGTLVVSARIDQAVDFGTQTTINLGGNSPGLGPTGSFTLGVSVLGGAATSRNRVTFAQLVGTMLGVRFTESTNHALTLYDMEFYGNRKGLRAS